MGPWLDVLRKFNVLDIIDILIVSFVLYRFLIMIRGTRAVPLLKGVIVILIAYFVSSVLHLQALRSLVHEIITIGVFAIPVVFQPELRRALEQLGRGGFFRFSLTDQGRDNVREMISEVVKASQVLAKNRIGALMALERRTGLTEYTETGTMVEGLASSELLINTFIPNTPLHDGAVVIRGNRMVAAGCFLPLTDDRNLDKKLGTRHRAAIGLTEQSDAVVVVVSEETGQVSVAVDGVLSRNLSESGLTEMLLALMTSKKSNTFHWFGRKAES